MPTYTRRTTVAAPLEDVWSFHSRASGLEAVSPGWLDLRIESVLGPDGERSPEILERGTELSLSIHPFGIGPRQYVTSVITDREREESTAYFRDEQVYGQFEEWIHTHAFFADGERTRLLDHVDYELPFGSIGRFATPVSAAVLEAMFRERHRRTRAALE